MLLATLEENWINNQYITKKFNTLRPMSKNFYQYILTFLNCTKINQFNISFFIFTKIFPKEWINSFNYLFTEFHKKIQINH